MFYNSPMASVPQRWILRKEVDQNLCLSLAQKYKLFPLLVKLLLNRELEEFEFEDYLNPSWDKLHNPFLMKGMSKAVERILCSLKRKEKILVYGDYDADGITATSLLLRFMQDFKFRSYYYIPHRQNEGYGLNKKAVKKAFHRGIKVIITCDCGTSSLEEIEFARSLDMEVIVTDHHRVEKAIPTDFIVINPHQPDCNYPFKELAGVGVAFKLLQALFLKLDLPVQKLQSYLDLVALGTLADVVSLKGENRILVKLGLDQLSTSTTPLGIRALINAVGLAGRKITEKEVTHILVPRINACGRLSLAKTAVKLILTQAPKEALILSRKLNSENSSRQSLEKKMCQQAEDMLPEKLKPVLVLSKENWHTGVIGLVASYIREKYYRPTLVFSINGDQARGSARSIPGFSIFKALEQCKHLITSFGGHEMAAGLTCPRKNIPCLEERLNTFALEVLSPEDFIPSFFFDSKLELENLSLDLLEKLDVLSPFGPGNPPLLFLASSAKILSLMPINRGMKIILGSHEGKKEFEAVCFSVFGENERKIAPGDLIDILYVPFLQKWRGKSSIQLEIKDWRKTCLI